MFRYLFNVTLATLTVTALAAPAQARDLSASRALHEEGLALATRIENVGLQLQLHADRLTALARNTALSRESHLERLEAAMVLLREDLLPALQQLEQIQDGLPDWKQKSVQQLRAASDRVSAHLAAATATALAEQRMAPALNEAYQVHVSAAARHVETLVATSDAAGSYLLGRLKAADLSLMSLVG